MASRRAGSGAAGLARKFVAAADLRRGGVCALESTRRVVSSSAWSVPQRENVEPRLLPSVAPWTHHHPVSGGIFPWALQGIHKHPVLFSSAEEHRESTRDDDDEEEEEEQVDNLAMNVVETRKILQQVNAVALKKRLKSDPRDSFSYRELLDFLKESGTVANDEEAMRLARILDKAGVVLIFRENVYIHPERVSNPPQLCLL